MPRASPNNNPAQLNQTLLRQLAQWNEEVQTALPEARSLSVADILRWNGVLESAALPADALHAAVLESDAAGDCASLPQRARARARS